MKSSIITIFLIVSAATLFGQGNEAKYKFATDVFHSKKYSKHDYQKFQNVIELVGNETYKFGDKILKISIDDKRLQGFFELGIFNPDVVFGTTTTKQSDVAIDSLSKSQKVFYNLLRNDSLSICCFEELEKLNPNSQTKRFKFWLYRPELLNPTEYYIEFYNDKATKDTVIEDFIKKSKITFFYQGTIII
jgi:hypothetical protein